MTLNYWLTTDIMFAMKYQLHMTHVLVFHKRLIKRLLNQF